MAYNNLSGTVLLPAELIKVEGVNAGVVSGNLSTSDGAEVINVPRISNATNNAIITNVGGDANTLTCESNLTFDGTTLNIAGELTSVGTTFMSGAVVHKRKLVNANYSVATTDYYVGVDTTNNTVKLTLPEATQLLDGQTIIIKDEGGSANSNHITVSGSASDTIDGKNTILLESPFASIQLYCNGENKFFIC